MIGMLIFKVIPWLWEGPSKISQNDFAIAYGHAFGLFQMRRNNLLIASKHAEGMSLRYDSQFVYL